jgi:pilus assembly protein TadC
MSTWTKVKDYIVEQAKFTGEVLLTTAVGGVIGSIVAGILGFADIIPLVTSASLWALPALGATLGFVVPFLQKLRK